MNLGNCPRCGKLFTATFREVCPACLKQIDQDYEKCATFLRENRNCAMGELSEETGVSVRQITKFIREGRISIVNAPNMHYPCEMCGAFIKEHHMCNDCRKKLLKDVAAAESDAAKQNRNGFQQDGVYRATYRQRD
ncbi:flagellar protein [Paenibacillaceae bacterium]|nr:flagellar protein [Paenibacillaceae bacterium]